MSAMDFAKKQMEKMGWKPGKGLGMREDGMAQPLKVQSQQDSCGLGFDRTSAFNTEIWFAKIDTAIRAARDDRKKREKKQQQTENEETVSRDEEEGDVVASESDTGRNPDEAERRRGANKFYTQFSKPQLMLRTSPKDEDEKQLIEAEEKISKKSRKRKSRMDLDEVYKKSKGATCHRSAHVGLKMSGKMKRLMQQEEEFGSK